MLLTHDFDTLIGYAWERVRAGLSMPGVLAVPHEIATGRAVEQLELYVVASRPSDLDLQVVYISEG